MTQKIKLLSTLLLFMITSECLAVPAYPKPVKVKQPDGTFVTLQMRGDEYLNYVMTEDGYTVVQDVSGRMQANRMTAPWYQQGLWLMILRNERHRNGIS